MDKYRDAVLRWHRERIPFGVIEDRINEMEELDQENQSALWLYAWSLRSHAAQLRESSEMMQLTVD